MNISPDQYITKRTFYLIIFFIFLWMFLFIPSKSYGQLIARDTLEYRFWYSSFDARATAMANASVADPFNVNGIYSNPATLIFSTKESSLISNSLYNSSRNVLLENVTASLNRNKNHHLVGATTIHHSVLKKDPLNPNLLQFTQLDLTLGYAWLLFPSLSAGLKVNSLYGKTTTSEIWTYNASFGLLYTPSSLVSYGLVYKGTGLTEGWMGSEPVYQLASDNETVVYSINVPHRLELGLTLRFPSLVRYPDLVLSLSNEKIFGLDGLIYKGGLEVYFKDLIALRGGYFLSPFTEGARLGFGFLFETFKLDYAYAPTSIDLTGKSHQLSISLNL